MRGWQRVEGDDWDLIWSEKEFINELYEKKLTPHQKINHFRNYYELCKKDQLVKNLKKHRKTLQRQGRTAEAAHYHFYPQTYVLPNEYVLFADEFRKTQALQDNKNIWIMKPTGKSQGKGIFLFNRLAQIAQWENHAAEPYIAQKYLNDPLLIGGKKFDIRLYALVTNYSPLTIYFYRGGFARFTHCRYDQTKIQNAEMHLTNVAIQKHAEGYDQAIGGKWYIEQLKLYMLSKYGEEQTNESFFKIQEIVIRTLEALQKVMASDRNNSFELYGFDILLDSHLQPWLIQVNGSPSMTANTSKDRDFKIGLLDDTLTILDMQKLLLGNEQQIGGFDLIFKGKPLRGNQRGIQGCHRTSFLATKNNRLDQLRKLAKEYAPRLNALFQTKDKKKVASRVATANNTANNSSHSSKRNINRKLYPSSLYQQVKPLTSTFNQTNLSNNNNESLNLAAKRDFIIKQRFKREVTNENEDKY